MPNAAEHHVGRGDVIAARPAPPWSRLAPLPAGTRPRGCPAPRVELQPVLDEHGSHKISGALSQPQHECVLPPAEHSGPTLTDERLRACARNHVRALAYRLSCGSLDYPGDGADCERAASLSFDHDRRHTGTAAYLPMGTACSMAPPSGGRPRVIDIGSSGSRCDNGSPSTAADSAIAWPPHNARSEASTNSRYN